MIHTSIRNSTSTAYHAFFVLNLSLYEDKDLSYKHLYFFTALDRLSFSRKSHLFLPILFSVYSPLLFVFFHAMKYKFFRHRKATIDIYTLLSVFLWHVIFSRWNNAIRVKKFSLHIAKFFFATDRYFCDENNHEMCPLQLSQNILR